MNAIFAVNTVDGFGTGVDMPWPKSTVDLKRFKELTHGGTVVMGAGTWNSNMPKPLPGRRNIVLSKTLEDDRCDVYRSVTDLLLNTGKDEQLWVIGGAKVLWTLRTFVYTVYLTRFADSTPATVTLDTAKYLDDFSLTTRTDFGDHVFEIWNRNTL